MSLQKRSPSSLHTEVLSFFLGALVSAFAGLLIDKSLELVPALLAGGLLVLGAWAILYMTALGTRISKFLDNTVISLKYLHEPFDPERGFKPTGQLYSVIEELVSKAQCQILVLAVSWENQDKLDGLDSPFRQAYLRAIEKKLAEKVEEGFEYIRLIQIPPGHEGQGLDSLLDRTTHEHCERIGDIASAVATKPGFRIRFFRTSKVMAGGFILIDQRYLIIGLDGTSVSQRPCFSGLLVVEDRWGFSIKEWLSHFGDLKDSSSPVRFGDLARQPPPASMVPER